jgi:hypothetical protein
MFYLSAVTFGNKLRFGRQMTMMFTHHTHSMRLQNRYVAQLSSLKMQIMWYQNPTAFLYIPFTDAGKSKWGLEL